MVLRQTKFLVPRSRGARMARGAALELLCGGAEPGVALLVAAAGYGKTSLMAEAVGALGLPTLWMQLDDADNDPVAFAGYLAEGIGRTLPATGARLRELLADAGPHPAERILALLANELHERPPAPWLLVLDDYHLIRNPAVHRLVADWLETPPPGMRAMIASRIPPELPLARWRPHGRLLELGAAELRFDDREARRWLGAVAPELEAEVAERLVARAEGWGVGLQLSATLASERGGRPADPEGVPEPARTRAAEPVSGAHPHLAGYLLSEVFDRLDAEDRHFLLATAVLPQLAGDLVGDLLGDPEAHRRLERLARAQLFLVPLDPDGRWYRYHGLFREFLLARLSAREPERLARLRARAARILEARGETEAALRAFLENGDDGNAARLLGRVGPALLGRGRVAELADHLDRLGTAARESPELLLLHGRALRRLGRPTEAELRLAAAGRLARERCRSDLAARATVERAGLAHARGDYAAAREHAAAALTDALTDAGAERTRSAALPAAVRATALMELARNEGLLRGMDRGRELAEEAVAAAAAAGDALGALQRARLLRSLGQICWWRGDVGEAVAACQSALAELPALDAPPAAEVRVMLAVPMLYLHRYDEALEHARAALALFQRFEVRERLPAAYAVLGNTLTRLGEFDRAETHLRRAIELAADAGVAAYDRVMAAGYLAYNLQRQERTEEAIAIAETALWRHQGRPVVYEVYVARSVLADLYLAAERRTEAHRIFEDLVEIGERLRYRIPLAMAHFGSAYLHLERGERRAGRVAAERSLELLEPTGAWELYTDQGARARRVCAALAETRPGNRFVATVVEALGAAERHAAHETGPAPALRSAERGDAAVALRTLGALTAIRDGAAVPASAWVSTKALELLALFVTFRHEAVPLDRAMEALWPDAPERDSAAFHSALYRLRSALRRDGEKTKFVAVRAKRYQLERDRFDLDIDRFEGRLAQARARRARGDRGAAERAYREALALYRGDYFADFDLPWLEPERQRLRHVQLGGLADLAGLLETAGEVEAALEITRRLLRCEPLHEPGHRRAMRLLHRLGDRRGVTLQYRRLRDLLADELSLAPLPATVRLYRELGGDG